MDWLFRTEVIIYLGIFFAAIYVLRVLVKKGSKYLELENILSVFISGASILGSFKLVYNTITKAHFIKENIIETDQIYIICGGICVFWISVKSLNKRMSIER